MTEHLPYDVYILIDTNAYYGNLYFQGKKFQALQRFTDMTHSVVILPSILREELKKKHRETISKDLSTTERIKKTYGNAVSITIDAEEIQQAYEKRIDGTLAGFATFDSGSIPVQKLLERSLAEKPPFGKSDKGFRDALIWESALEFIRKRKKKMPLVVVTNNTSDFGKDGLAPELIDEAKALGIKTYHYQTIEDMLQNHSAPIDFITMEAVEAILDEHQGYLESVAEDSGDDIEIDKYDVDESDVEEAKVWGRPQHVGHSAYSYYIYDEDEDFIYVEAEVEIEVEAEVEYEYRVHTYDRDDDDWPSTRTGYTVAYKTIATTIPMKFDKETKEGEIN